MSLESSWEDPGRSETEFEPPPLPYRSRVMIFCLLIRCCLLRSKLYAFSKLKHKIDVRLHGETAWLTQQHMSDLFQTTQRNISLHLQNIYEEGELQRAATHKEFLLVRQERNRQVQRPVDYFNLDAIISIGYRVKSAVATRFRVWATQKLREFMVKGFVLDDERLKNPNQPFDYFGRA